MSDEAEKEIVYELETCVSKDSYIKPLYGKVSRKFKILNSILNLLIMAEFLALAILDKSYLRIVWIIFLAFDCVINVFHPFILRRNTINQYEKLHEAKEDCITYTFYNDCVKAKAPVVEATFYYKTAEFLVENSDRLLIVFPFSRTISIEKSQCDEEMLDFIRKTVPEENQKKSEKETASHWLVKSSLLVLCAAALAILIVVIINQNAHVYNSEYIETTYTSFEACLEVGTVDDIVIVDNKYIEYTFTGRGKDERYYTVYSGDDINLFTEKLDIMDVTWRFE